MYDLTALLTTRSACSASVVAILGGLIAGKLIALNTERDEVNTRISEIDEEIDFFSEERDMLQASLDEDDALDFIKANISGIINQETLDDTYRDEDRPRLDKDVLRPYWDRAERVYALVCDALHYQEDRDRSENEDGVPASVACRLSQDFEYEVGKRICNYFEEQRSPLTALRHISDIAVDSGRWYADTQEKAVSADNKVTYLMLQKKQLTARKKALEKSGGMKSGLALFSAFTLLNIVVPLFLSPFSTEIRELYLAVRFSVLAVFTVSLSAIILYLIYLLRWNGRGRG